MSTQGEYLTAIADAIREKEGSTDTIVASDFASRISAIASDTTATASDILSGKTAYTADGEVTGTIATKTSSDLTVSTNTVTAPAGYYASDATGTVATATQATPSISVASSTGVITASATQTAGYVAAGTKNATYSLTTQAAKTVTPSTSSQTAVASGRYTTGAVTVAGDSNLTAANIASGVSIFGVTGTYAGMPNLTMVSKTGLSAESISFTSLSFTPSAILVVYTGTTPSSSDAGYTFVTDTAYSIGDYSLARVQRVANTRIYEFNVTATFETSSVTVQVITPAGVIGYFEGDYTAYIW